MISFELKDRFSSNNQQYLLQTTVEAERRTIKFVYFRRGKAIYIATKAFDPSLNEEQIKQLASTFHESHKREIALLFQLIDKLQQKAAKDVGLDLLARGFLKYGMALEAIALLSPLLHNNGAFPQARFTLGKAYLKIEKYEAAREQFRHILTTHKKYADTHFFLGLCEYNLEKCASAFQAFAKAVEINPHYGEAYYLLGLTLILNAILKQEADLIANLSIRAHKIFAKAVEFLPELKGEVLNEGLQSIKDEQFQQAFDTLEPLVLKIDKKNALDIVNYKFHLNVLLDPQTIKPEQVWAEIRRLQNLTPKYAKYPDLHFELGFSYAVLGASVASTSLNHFAKAIELNPEYKNALKGIGFIQNDQRGYHTMLRALVQAY